MRKAPTQFNTAGPYHLLYEEVPYSKRLEVMPYDPSRYRDEALRGWNNPEDVHFLYHEDSGTQGFITHSDRVILISIRGTQGLKDILTDLDGRQEPFSGGVGQAHRGFHGGFKAAQAFVQRYLDAFYHPDHSIMVCGHSLGGAIALLLAEWLRREPKQPQVQLYTFGAPRAGDRTFVQGAQELIHHRLVNHNDLIPGVPTPWLDAEWKLLMAGTATLHLSPLGGVTLLLAGLLNLEGDPYEHHGEQRHFMPRKKDARSEASILWQPGCEALESLTCAQYAGLLDLQGDMPQRGQPSLAEHSSDTGYSRAALTTLLRWTASLERDGELFSREEAGDLAEQVKALERALADWRPGSYLQFRRAVRLRQDRRFYNKSEEELRRLYNQGVLLASQLAHSQRQQLTRTLLRLQTQGQRLITPQAVFGEFAQRPDLPELVSQWRAAKENRHAERLARLPVPQERVLRVTPERLCRPKGSVERHHLPIPIKPQELANAAALNGGHHLLERLLGRVAGGRDATAPGEAGDQHQVPADAGASGLVAQGGEVGQLGGQLVHTEHRAQVAPRAGLETATLLGRGIGGQLRTDEHHQQTLRLCLLLGGAQQIGKFDDIHAGNSLWKRAARL